MKKLLTISTILFLSYISFSQDYSDPQNMDVNYNREAEFPGGMQKFIQEVWSKMEYTDEAINARVDGEIMVSFDVNADSTVSDISILNGLDYGINQDFKRVLKTLKFIPAVAEGNLIKQNMILNVPIRVAPNSKRKSSQ
jgi:TonB family protein